MSAGFEIFWQGFNKDQLISVFECVGEEGGFTERGALNIIGFLEDLNLASGGCLPEDWRELNLEGLLILSDLRPTPEQLEAYRARSDIFEPPSWIWFDDAHLKHPLAVAESAASLAKLVACRNPTIEPLVEFYGWSTIPPISPDENRAALLRDLEAIEATCRCIDRLGSTAVIAVVIGSW